MKMHGAKSVHYDSGPNMTPLVDVVMVILIFLMLAGSFGAATHFLPSAAYAGDGLGPRRIAPPSLDVFVSSLADGTMQARLSGGELYHDAPSLQTALSARRQQYVDQGMSQEATQVVICPRRNTRYDDVAAVYQAVLEARWPKVTFRSARE